MLNNDCKITKAITFKIRSMRRYVKLCICRVVVFCFSYSIVLFLYLCMYFYRLEVNKSCSKSS